MPEQQTNIYSAIQSLPEHVWDWLTSDVATLSITEINNRLGFKSEKRQIIPSLILKLVTQNLDPMDFINELSHELNISFQAAKAIAEEIESRVLKPIETELRRDVGVDVKLIYFGKPSAQRAEPKIPEEKISPIGPIRPIGQVETAPSPLPSDLSAKALASAETLAKEGPPKPIISGPTEWEKLRREEKISPIGPIGPIGQPAPAAPFILHQETPVAPLTPKTKAEPSLNIKVKDYYQNAGEEKKLSGPVPVQVEYSTEQKTRVVHYNEMRTPLTNIGTPKAPPSENRVDLRKFARPDINTLDLRKKQ
ncbi:MAG: hypothetical protein HYY86_01550 [Candidatus Harrisonbacteria bacterium]|nr:hypothetical protein [Candidatus Harrisonbacteria bacterium]